MRISLRRGRRSVLAVVVPVGLVLSMALTWSSTHAAFSASTANPGNSWQTGSVVLADNDRDAALFQSASESRLTPGVPRSRCIRLDYKGDVAADIRMYVGMPTDGVATLDSFLVMSVERGEDVVEGTTVTPDCLTGFRSRSTPTFLFNSTAAGDSGARQTDTLAALRSRADYDSGLPVSSATPPGTSITLKISYVVKDDDKAQRTRSDATFTWEARNP